jgi:choline dehydrogenase
MGAGPMRPTSRGSLKLRSTDPFEPPILDPQYLSTEKDLRELIESYEVLQDVVSQPAFEPFKGKPLEPKVMPTSKMDIIELIRNMAGSGFHLSGSCKMGRETDREAVVDPTTKVRGN